MHERASGKIGWTAAKSQYCVQRSLKNNGEGWFQEQRLYVLPGTRVFNSAYAPISETELRNASLGRRTQRSK